MLTDVGEYIVGAYLQVIEGCDFVDYNVRPPGGGLAGLQELDVIGLNFRTDTAYLCEVTTHIRGLRYRDNPATVERIAKKHHRQEQYAEEYLDNFSNHRFMFWSPVVPKGFVTEGLSRLTKLELIINQEYTQRVDALRLAAESSTHDARNPFFRILQILEHLRK